ncbi:MAG: TlpA family protein disulfide reductase [Bacteroidota bacterium]|nr:TlpA family protein disulfide reductase [Bacteroidota bacterium]
MSDSLLNIWYRDTPDSCMAAKVMEKYHKEFSFVGSSAPDFNLKNLDGSVINLSDLRGKVVLLDFWSVTCAPCLKAIPSSNEFQSAFKNEDFVLVTICCDSGDSAWRTVIKNKKWQGTHLFANNQKLLMHMYNVGAFPTYILIDKNGKIAGTVEGPGEQLKDQVRLLLQ